MVVLFFSNGSEDKISSLPDQMHATFVNNHLTINEFYFSKVNKNLWTE